MQIDRFLLVVETRKNLHQIVVEAKNETSARLRLLAEYKDATIISVTKIKDYKNYVSLKMLKAIEVPHFLIKRD